MSKRYTNKELVHSLRLLDTVLSDILYNSYEYIEVLNQKVQALKDKEDEQSKRDVMASAHTMSLINFLVHPAHETSKRYFPDHVKQIHGYIHANTKALELGYATCFCSTMCDPDKSKFKKRIEEIATKMKEAEEANGEVLSNKSAQQ